MLPVHTNAAHLSRRIAMNATRAVRAVALGAVAIVAIACGSDSITGAPSVDGTYALRTLNGVALPVTVSDSLDGVPVQITFMSPTSFTLSSDHKVRIISTVRIVFGTINEVQTDTTSGTYALNGQQVTFSRPGESSFTAAWNGSDALTVVDNGTFVFRK